MRADPIQQRIQRNKTKQRHHDKKRRQRQVEFYRTRRAARQFGKPN